MHGWLPLTVQVIAALAVIIAVSRRSGRWQVRWLPWALIVGCALAASAYWFVASPGLADNPAPRALWIWIGLTGVRAAGLAQSAVVAARRLGSGGAAHPAMRWTGAEYVGRLLPDSANRVEPIDLGA